MTHAMVITAVHLDSSGNPVRYKVENSWGDTAGEKGWFVMSDKWFEEYVLLFESKFVICQLTITCCAVV